MLRVCVIGMGPIGNLHAGIYTADELSELVGVCDIVGERARQAGEVLHCLYRGPASRSNDRDL